MKIKAIKAKKILDSRGVETVEVKLKTNSGVFIAAAPSGTSSGRYEATAIDVKKALYNVREVITPKLLEKEFSSQKEVDKILIEISGPNKENMGVNAVLPVSIAVCRALAAEKKLPLYAYINYISLQRISSDRLVLPRPCVLLIEGGKHAHPVRGGASNGARKLDVQEFMVTGEFNSFKENYEAMIQVYEALERVLAKELGKDGIRQGLEGGFAPAINKTEQALEFIMQAIKRTLHEGKIKIGLDVAASEFWEAGQYNFEGKLRQVPELVQFYQSIVNKYPILFIEDPFAEDDFEGWQNVRELRDKGVLIVGDDLTVTNLKRIHRAQQIDLCNATIIKPNQIGTVTETIEAACAAQECGWKRIVSHRSGDTMDDFIADLAVGIGAEFIKSGGPFAKERKVKYDRLLAIEKEIC